MSPAALRVFFAAGLAFLIGGGLGVWATRAIYGEGIAPVDPAPVRPKPCPPCGECPVCPPPPDCGDRGLIPTSTAPKALLVPDDDEPNRDRKPGLPARAIQLATTTVKQSVASCVEEAKRTGAEGTILLELTVTATGGQGFISDAALAGRSEDARNTMTIESCVLEGARTARFDWGNDDGEVRFRLPISLSNR
jgi:hypothetical protein